MGEYLFRALQTAWTRIHGTTRVLPPHPSISFSPSFSLFLFWCLCTRIYTRLWITHILGTKTPRNWLEEAFRCFLSLSLFIFSILPLRLAFVLISQRLALLSKSFPRSPECAYKSGQPLFRETDPLTDHRRHRTLARYPVSRLEPELLRAERRRWRRPSVTAGISKPLDRKDEIAGEIRHGHGSFQNGKRQAEIATRMGPRPFLFSFFVLFTFFLTYGNTECVFNPSS